MAGHVITFAQQKGGSGKTTLAAHLAVTWALQGLAVAIIDIDPQGSLSAWYQRREQAHLAPLLTHVRVNGWRTQHEVESLARDHALVVLDSPPQAETEARIAVRVADVVIVPVQPSPVDVWATMPTLDLIRQEKARALLVANRVPSRANLADVVLARLADLGVPLAQARIGNRVAYAAAMLDGRTATEIDRHHAAAREIAALASELLGLLSPRESGRGTAADARD
jgi:chromosome partitioning protein